MRIMKRLESREVGEEGWWEGMTGMFAKVEHYVIMVIGIVLFAFILLCLWPCVMSAVQQAVKTTVGATRRYTAVN